MENASEIKLPTMGSIKLLIEPIYDKLKNIELAINSKKLKESDSKKYYRNSDLKNLFGLSPNTIIKYRETGVIPYTQLGEVYLYEAILIQQILEKNKISFTYGNH
jgi:hypothetical protein